MASVFIDGQAGTTGIEIESRLGQRADVELVRIDPQRRKDPEARTEALAQADVAILCLPDDAARETAQLADQLAADQGREVRLLDASTAHRTDPAWVYGLPELCAEQRDAIAGASRVSNPGCYPQGFILCVRPLIDAGLLPAEAHLTVNAVSGYSGGGRTMIEAYQCGDADREAWGARPYALTLAHKHVPEMFHFSGAAHPPVFAPTVAFYYKGLVTSVPLALDQFAQGTTAQDIQACLADAYEGERFITVHATGADNTLDAGYLSPTGQNDTNNLDIMVFASDTQVLLNARYDNLGKGAAGAAVQNLNLMLGVDETTGLVT